MFQNSKMISTKSTLNLEPLTLNKKALEITLLDLKAAGYLYP